MLFEATMTKLLSTLLSLCIFMNVSLQADEYAHFYPKLYQNLWPDFYLEHLEQVSCDLVHPDPQKLAHDFCGKGIKIGN